MDFGKLERAKPRVATPKIVGLAGQVDVHSSLTRSQAPDNSKGRHITRKAPFMTNEGVCFQSVSHQGPSGTASSCEGDQWHLTRFCLIEETQPTVHSREWGVFLQFLF